MWTGVCIGLAGTLFTGSPKIWGEKKEIKKKHDKAIMINNKSFTVK